jgi:hypothetical protein
MVATVVANLWRGVHNVFDQALLHAADCSHLRSHVTDVSCCCSMWPLTDWSCVTY